MKFVHSKMVFASRVAALITAACFVIAPVSAKDNIDYYTAIQAQPMPDPPKQVKIITMPVPLPLPEQLKPLPKSKNSHKSKNSATPAKRIANANEAARIQPESDGFFNAIQQYAYSEGALYQVYASPEQVTDIALQEGEQLTGSGPVAAGDTARWIIGDTTSGSGPKSRVHILVKPTRGNLKTNMVINTDRRTYHLELTASPFSYMASVSWHYPQDELIALRASNDRNVASAPIASGIDISALDFGYKIKGDKPDWRPVRAFDDGIRVFVEFPESISQGEMPPIFVIGASGQGELVNFRVSGKYIIVDRLFAAAELRLGDKKSQQKVRIIRAKSRSHK